MTDPDVLSGATTEAPAEQPSSPPRRRRRSMFEDPLVRTMAWFAIGLVILYLVGIVSALMLGVVGDKAPRTAAERALYVSKAKVDTGKADVQTVALYIAALIDVKQFSKAQSTIDQTIDKMDQSRGAEITIQQARLYYAKRDYRRAAETADKALAIINKKYSTEIKSKKLTQSRAYGRPESYGVALLVKAQSLGKLKEWKPAVQAYDTYIKQYPTAADILIERGYARIELKDAKGAEKDFRAALKFVPDDSLALEGLKKIGADR